MRVAGENRVVLIMRQDGVAHEAESATRARRGRGVRTRDDARTGRAVRRNVHPATPLVPRTLVLSRTHRVTENANAILIS